MALTFVKNILEGIKLRIHNSSKLIRNNELPEKMEKAISLPKATAPCSPGTESPLKHSVGFCSSCIYLWKSVSVFAFEASHM